MRNQLQAERSAIERLGFKPCVRVLSLIAFVSTASLLQADVTSFDMFQNVLYSQTSGAAPTTPQGYFVDFNMFFANPSDFDGASVTYPGPASPQTLSPNLPFSNYAYGSPLVPDLSGYPFGTYTFTATNSGTMASQTVSLDYAMNAFTSDIPALTAATFNALQGMNTTLPFTFDFNSFTPNASATYGGTFLSVSNSPFTVSLSNTATSQTMAANTLLPDTTYTYELDFSDRVNGMDGNVPYIVGFDMRTDGSFTTAALPEPSYLLPVGGAMMMLLAVAFRRRRAAWSPFSPR